MIYSIKDGKYSGDNTLSTAWGAAFIAGAAARGYECACWEDSETPDFHRRWVHTPADSPDNVAPKDTDVGGIAIYLTDAEYDTVLAASARQKRDRLIAATDYLVTPDYPIESDRLAKIETYRQALRDIPEQAGFPRTITWPDKP